MATATLTAGSRVRTVEPWMTESDDFSNCEIDAENDFDRLMAEDPQYREYVYRKLERAREDVAAGRVIPLADVIAEHQAWKKKHGLL